jgi:TonB family protein
MRSAIIISLILHLSVYFISTRIVQFARVKYIPRQVYSVNLLTMEEIEKMMQKKEEPPAEPPAEQEPPPKEEIAPPPEPKKKPEQKKEPVKQKKQVPSTEVKKPSAQENAGENSTSGDADQQTSTGDINLDSADFPFGYYLITIRRKIAGNWNVPQSQANKELFCRVHFRIARNGQIASPAIEESSGSFMFDQAALRAVMQASPLPPLPNEFRDAFLGVHFSFAYEEN